MRSHLLKVKYIDSKWIDFICLDIENNIEFTETGKYSYFGDMLQDMGLNIDKWESNGFIDVLNKMIEFKVILVWNEDNYGNMFPYDIEKDNQSFESFKNWMDIESLDI